ncbi:MAG: DNA-binding protein [Armatimonadetes bacterium]|nr:DNA-binding protein [Armatimonadota bacterium]
MVQYTEGQLGRVFLLRLEHGEPMPQSLEQFAAEKGVSFGLVVLVGGADSGSRLVVGPEDGTVLPPVPMVRELLGVHEVAGLGILAPGENGRPQLHMHAACGRGQMTAAGCIRTGLITWHVLEVLLIEVTGLVAARRRDEATGFSLLQCAMEEP